MNRTLPIRLDANMERPEQRDNFRHPQVKEYLAANLSRLQSAALSLVQHWMDAGRPDASELPRALRRFPGWLRTTAAILESCGFQDFAGNVVAFEDRAVSSNENAAHRFVAWWWDNYECNPVTSRELAPAALGDPDDDTSEGMLPIRGTNEKVRRTNLSKYINRLLDQSFELDAARVKLISVKTPGTKYQEWMLQRLDPSGGIAAWHRIAYETISDPAGPVAERRFGTADTRYCSMNQGRTAKTASDDAVSIASSVARMARKKFKNWVHPEMKPLDVYCASCFAVPGEPCTTVQGYERPAHTPRKRLAAHPEQCSACGAKYGEPCFNESGEVRLYPHTARTAAQRQSLAD